MALILARYGEIGIKGKNRHYFVRRLRQNMRAALKANAIEGRVWSEGQRIYAEVPDDDRDTALAAFQRVFGITSLSPVERVPANIESIQRAALDLARRVGLGPDKTFHTDARRADKSFPIISPEINRLVGTRIQAETGARVDLSENADLIVGVEVRREGALIFGERIPGPGGLPLGTQGRVVVLLSGGIDSPVAAWLMMRRGCGVIPVHFASNPVEQAKAEENCRVLAQWAYGWEIKPIIASHAEVLAETAQHLRRIGEDRWTCLFCKRAMIAKAAEIAQAHKARAIVLGDSLGQVASQTLENMAVITYQAPLPILRPLIGYDKVEIVELARKIGTFEISTRASESCPFLPPTPVTRAKFEHFLDVLERINAMNQQKATEASSMPEGGNEVTDE